MGMFDNLYGADPRTQGLLAAGAAMMSGPSRMPVSLGQSIGQGYLAGNQAYQQAMQAEMQRKQMEEQAKLRDLQVQEFKAKMEEAAQQRARDEQARQLFGRYTTQPQPANPADPVMGVDATPAQPAGFDLPGYAMALGSVDPGKAISLMSTLQKEDKPFVVTPGATLTTGRGVPLYTAPNRPEKPPEASPLAKMIAERDALPPNHPARKVYDEAIKKATTHSPGVSVSYGAPVAGVDASGNPVFFQPDKGGGKPAIIPGVAPPAPKLGEKQTNQISGIDSLSLAVDNYAAALNNYKLSDSLDINKRAAIGNAYNNMMLQAKEAYNLGVLNGPDYEILQKVVRDPTTLMGTLTSNDALRKQAMDLKREMNKVKASIQKNSRTAGGESVDPLGIR